MKKILGSILMLICMAVIIPVAVPVKTYAASEVSAVKQGLRKENGKYYYYVDGVKLTNSWKTVKNADGTKSRYYFGKTGAAYAAAKDRYHPDVIVVKKIDGVKYGFTSNGECVKGIYCDQDCMIYAFGKTRALDKEKTSKLRRLGKEGRKPGALLRYLGKEKKLKITDSCYGDGKDYDYYYAHFKVVVFVSRETGEKMIASFIPL